MQAAAAERVAPALEPQELSAYVNKPAASESAEHKELEALGKSAAPDTLVCAAYYPLTHALQHLYRGILTCDDLSLII